jgi:hypothetical protein
MIENICMNMWLMYIWLWEYMHVVVVGITYAWMVCKCLHEHIWMCVSDGTAQGMSDGTARGLSDGDYPIYVEIGYYAHTFHSCVCQMGLHGVCQMGPPNPAGFYWVGVCQMETSPALRGLVGDGPTTLCGEVNSGIHACDDQWLVSQWWPVIGFTIH